MERNCIESLRRGNAPLFREIISLLVVFATSTVVFLALAPLDPDPHHDGFQLAAATAVAQGANVHVDVFNQYGPITTEIHAAVLSLFGEELITLRIANAMLLVATAMLAYVIARLLRLGVVTSIYAVVLWVALCPAGGVFGPELQLWPWPSVVFTLLAQCFLIVILVLLKHPRLTWNWVLLGLLSILLLTTRANQGLALITLVLISVMLTKETRLWLRTNIRKFLGGVALGLVVLVAYLILRSDLRLFMIDSITGPIVEYVMTDPDGTAKVLKPIDVSKVVMGSYVLASLPTLFVGTVLFLLLRKKSASVLVAYVGCFVSIVLLAVVASLGFYGRARDSFIQFAGTLMDIEMLNALGSSPLYAAWLISVCASIATLVVVIFRKLIFRNNATRITIFFAAALATQVFPRWDIYHLWWAGPMLLISALSLVSQHLTQFRVALLACAISLPFTMVALYSTFNNVSEDRVLVSDGPLSGMRILPERQGSITGLLELSRSLGGEKALILCSDGLMAVPGGTFVSDRANFIDWGWSQAPAAIKEPRFIVMCFDKAGTMKAGIEPFSARYTVINGPSHVNLSPWSQQEFVLLERNSKSPQSIIP